MSVLSGLPVWLAAWIDSHTTTDVVWIILGFVAQALFTARFVVQWIASERAKRSIVPVAFWYFSVMGGGLLLAYAVYRMDPVFIFGQAGGLLVYLRNLQMIRGHRRKGDDTAEVKA